MTTAAETPLSRPTRAFIVLTALLQGLLLYLAQTGQYLNIGVAIGWYSLVLGLPTAMMLSVTAVSDRQFWLHSAALGALVAALAAGAAWHAGGAPDLRLGGVVAPFGLSLAALLFIALPWLQCRLAHGRWHAPYAELSGHAWQNALTLALAVFFTGICWAVLLLWAGLFELVKIRFFSTLFGEKGFYYLATGTMAGLGVLIGRTQQRAVRVVQQIVFAICTGLLPLLAFVALLFVCSLPFTGLQALWQTRSAAALLLSLMALLVLFANAVFRDGSAPPPWPRWLRLLVDAALLSLPLYAALALYALLLRVGQHGWTVERFWGVLAALIAAAHALGYAWATLRQRGQGWLPLLPRINAGLSLAVMAVLLLANSPLLDPYRISSASQLRRLDAGRISAAELDLDYLRFHNGRRGYQSLQALRGHPAFAGDATQRQRLESVLLRKSPYESDANLPLRDEALMRQQISIAPAGSAAPDAGWWQALLDSQLPSGNCLHAGQQCVAIVRDLDGDGLDDALLCQLPASAHSSALCHLHAKDAADGPWKNQGILYLSAASLSKSPQQHQEAAAAFHDALRAGAIAQHPQRWPNISVGDTAPRQINTP